MKILSCSERKTKKKILIEDLNYLEDIYYHTALQRLYDSLKSFVNDKNLDENVRGFLIDCMIKEKRINELKEEIANLK